jgi:hypothetical protein
MLRFTSPSSPSAPPPSCPAGPRHQGLACQSAIGGVQARSRYIPALSFAEDPPTYTETCLVQRFQASPSAFSTIWNFLALMALLFWLLFYAL